MDILALPISAYSNKTLKGSYKAGYPVNPQTIGQHIRKRRMDVGLLQKDVASIIGTSTDCITFWENERSQPQIHFYPKIISFLGYYPFEEVETFGGMIKKYRHLQGLNHKQMGALLGVHGTTIGSWEAEKTIPNESMVRNVHTCISS